MEAEDIPKETVKVLTRLIKEILRGTASLFDETAQTRPIIPFSVLIFAVGYLTLRRYTVLLPFLMTFNLCKLVNSLKNKDLLLKILGEYENTGDDS